jgi:hypothetical protein
MIDHLGLQGRYQAVCHDASGIEKWRDFIDKTVMTEGKNLALDTILAGSAYTVTGPYMGLISATGYTAIAAADTGAQINGTNQWKEAGTANTPHYTTVRKTCVFSAAAAGSKALSAGLVFTITSTGPDNCKGAFVLFGSAALNTIDDAHGTLLSAGLFAGGDKSVSSGDTITITWSLAA